MGAKCRVPNDPLDELDDECDASVDNRDILMIGKTGDPQEKRISKRVSLSFNNYFGRRFDLGCNVF